MPPFAITGRALLLMACLLQAQPAGAFLGTPMPLHPQRSCAQASRALPLRRLPLSRICMSEADGEPKDGEGKVVGQAGPGLKQEEAKKPDTALQAASGGKVDDFESLDPTQRKFKAAALRKNALDLDAEAQDMRSKAIAKEKEAALLRIEAWKAEGAVSSVSKQVITSNLKDKYEKELAELDLMAADWVDADAEKWEWFQEQRQMILQMIGIQQQKDELADQQLSELKETLLEMQEMFNIETVTEKGDITRAGWGFVIFSAVVPVWIGYTLFEWVFASFSALGGAPDPFAGL